MFYIFLFLLSFYSYGAVDTSMSSFSGIIPLLPRAYENIPYKDFPSWCSDSVDEQELGQTLTYTKYPDGPDLHGFITENGDVRIAVADRTNNRLTQIYRVLTFKKNSKGIWYQCRSPIQIWLVMRKGGLTCQNH